MQNSKKIEIIGIFLYFTFISYLVVFLELGYLFSAFVFIGPPSFYITVRNKSIFKKTALFSILFSIPMVVIVNYMGTVNKAWLELTETSIKVLEVVPVESFIWGLLMIYFIIAFYEYFFDKDKIKTEFSQNIKYLIYFVAFLISLFGVIWLTNKDLLVVSYFYIYLVIILFILPTLVTFLRYPVLIKKIVCQGLFFLLLGVMYEIAALYAGHWEFPGEYVGMLNILEFKIPVEEFLWLIFWVPAIISIYEITADDKK